MQLRLTAIVVFGFSAVLARPAAAQFHFSTGSPDGLMATASRPGAAGKLEIESADDFLLPGSTPTLVTHASFYGLITGGDVASVNQLRAEIYRVFPFDSTVPPSGNVPTRTNSPSDVALVERDSSAADLAFSVSVINSSFTAGNSVLNGIFPKPNQNTQGEGPVTGQEVLFDVSFSSPISLLPGHYFFVPQVGLSAGEFYWLSAPKPISGGPGTTPFLPDLQSWIRNEDLAPDWLRVGTDIVGGAPAPTFNAAFSLDGHAVPESASTGMLAGAGALLLALAARRQRTPAG